MKAIVFLGALPLALALMPAPAGVVETHVAALQAAKQLTATIRVTVVGGSYEEQTLILGRDNFLKWESPARLVLSDGKMVTTYDKGKKTYTQAPVVDGWYKTVFAGDEIWAWSAFFDANFAKQVTGNKAGATKTQKGITVSEVTWSREKGPITQFIEKKSGIARGGIFKNAAGADVVVQVLSFEISDKPADAVAFAWTPPAGATVAVAEDPNKPLVYADIKPILDRRCGECHARGNAKGNVRLGTYQDVMSSNVVAGSSGSSRLITVTRSGSMPPRNPLGKADIDKLAKWIDDGAKE